VGGPEPGTGAVVGLMARIIRPGGEVTDLNDWARQRLAEMHAGHRRHLEAQAEQLRATLAGG
jgi:hypothetical protein